jgi:hypothetical protein
MKTMEPFPVVVETTGLRELLQQHPKAIRVLLDRDVPISCAGGTVGDAARACGVPSATLVSDLLACIEDGRSISETDSAERPSAGQAAYGIASSAQAVLQSTSGEIAPPVAWHALPMEAVLRRLQAQVEAGLSKEEAGRRLAAYGPNTIQIGSKKKRKPWWLSLRWGSPGWSGRRWGWD